MTPRMQKCGNLYQKGVYMFVFPNGKLYVGCVYGTKQNFHKTSTPMLECQWKLKPNVHPTCSVLV